MNITEDKKIILSKSDAQVLIDIRESEFGKSHLLAVSDISSPQDLRERADKLEKRNNAYREFKDIVRHLVEYKHVYNDS